MSDLKDIGNGNTIVILLQCDNITGIDEKQVYSIILDLDDCIYQNFTTMVRKFHYIFIVGQINMYSHYVLLLHAIDKLTVTIIYKYYGIIYIILKNMILRI